MKIFLFDRKAAGHNIGYDECRAMVIVADGTGSALEYAMKNARDEGAGAWVNIRAKVLGEAYAGVQPRIVCSDINNG